MPDLEFIPSERSYATLWHGWRLEDGSTAYNPIDDASVQELADRLAEQRAEFDRLEEGKVHRWFLRAHGKVVGTFALERLNKEMKRVAFGYQIGGEFSGRGLGTQGLRAFIDELFERSDIERLEGTVHHANAASHRVLTKVGFTAEGVMRDYLIIEGRRVDFTLYALLRSEWRAGERPAPHFVVSGS